MAQDAEQQVTISMAAEVSDILDSMETIIGLQRDRCLERLRAPLWVRRGNGFSPFVFDRGLYPTRSGS
jgi:hypothetical protein